MSMGKSSLLTAVALAVIAFPIPEARPAGRPAPGPPQAAPSETDRLIFPDPRNEILVVRATGEKAGELPVGEILPAGDPLAAKVLEELRLPFNRSMIKLSQCSRNLSGRRDGPNVLFLSREEGGFPRHGLALREGGRVRAYPDLNYVDLVIDEPRLQAGELSIYAHELGHVMMMNVGPELPERGSALQHVSMGVTDPPTAFNEGWGEHFQRLAYEGVPKYRQTFLDGFGTQRGWKSLWHSTVDEDLRVEGVLRNIYVWRKAMPVDDPMAMPPAARVLLHHTSPLFDRTRLKSGSEMLACEGVLATLFYRLATSEVLRSSFAPAPFYRPFLLAPLPEGIAPRDLFTPLENAMLKAYRAWEGMKGGPSAGPGRPSAPFLDFVDAWIRAVPADREELIRIVLETTAGRTADPAPGRLLEKAALSGLVGDYFVFKPALADYDKAMAELSAGVLAGQIKLGAALGPEIWIENPAVKVRTVLWGAEEKALKIDLNTCSAWDLTTFPGITLDRARTIIEERDKTGFFASLEAARKAGFAPFTR